jgi:hypothetical protein
MHDFECDPIDEVFTSDGGAVLSNTPTYCRGYDDGYFDGHDEGYRAGGEATADSLRWSFVGFYTCLVLFAFVAGAICRSEIESLFPGWMFYFFE